MMYARVSLLQGGSSAMASSSPASMSSSEPESAHRHTHSRDDTIHIMTPTLCTHCYSRM